MGPPLGTLNSLGSETQESLVKLHPQSKSDAAHLFNLLFRGFKPRITLLSTKGCFCYFYTERSCDPITTYNELNVKENKKRCLLDLAKDDIFLYSHVFFFKYDWEIYSKEHDVRIDPHTPRTTSRLLLIITKSF